MVRDMWRAISEFMCSEAGQTLCVVLFGVCLAAYIACIIFENKWGDGE